MTKLQAIGMLVGIWAAIGVPLIAASMFLCKRATGKWWRYPPTQPHPTPRPTGLWQ